MSNLTRRALGDASEAGSDGLAHGLVDLGLKDFERSHRLLDAGYLDV
jgi:hypothetical protein